MKLRIFIFILVTLSSGLALAEESNLFSSHASTAAEGGFNLGYGHSPMADRAIDERIIEQLGVIDAPDSGQSSRYNVELDLENEDSDWSFEVTVTVEF